MDSGAIVVLVVLPILILIAAVFGFTRVGRDQK
jgi:ABC-type uncharacterized transport system involved in gliding motility auxiliary subunit